ncbi:SRPBCC family protein [Sphingomonas colocasiae]|uniref:SRPBCC family protein n=1 Tax=Sphingomonas colocasiae TaxID=1848973 RepID=A0ABS7PQQ7_9SPHN|nr:SRPBCC family protein [Sphingomonas colocasiae]MBY8823659.1 SRPBCC family protein [Sphingomonas colocasiae]
MSTTTETRAAVHSSFRIERHYEAPPSRVFFAFSDTASKRRWLVEGEGFEVFDHQADFRVGGHEISRFRFGEGPEIINETVYQDIVPDQRIIYSYRMAMGDEPMSASLTTIEFTPAEGGTLLVLTEQGAYLDGRDDGTGREEGTRGLLEILAKEVEG